MTKEEADVERAVLLDDPDNERSPDTPRRLAGFDGIAESDEALEAKAEQTEPALKERSFTELLLIVRGLPPSGLRRLVLTSSSVCTDVSRHVAGCSGQYYCSGFVCVCGRRVERTQKYELDIYGVSAHAGFIAVRNVDRRRHLNPH